MFSFLFRIQRIWWQATWAVLFNFPFLEHLTFAWMTVPVLNCYACPLAQGACPIGTFQHFLVIGAIPFLVVGVISVFGMLAGRFYCSHLCPFGFFQDLLAKIPFRKRRIPAWTGYGKYAVLIIMVIILPPIVKEPFFCTLCPAGSLEAGIPIVSQAWAEKHFGAANEFGATFGILGMIGWWFWFKIGLLATMIGAAMVIRRPFCRTICPLGAVFGIFNRISILAHPPEVPGETKPRYNLKTCPVQITHPDHIDSHHCIKCRECYKKQETGARSQESE
ncbi:MAG: 4Fe-4S binding protein [Candidatus Latescibacterota bacterium]